MINVIFVFIAFCFSITLFGEQNDRIDDKKKPYDFKKDAAVLFGGGLVGSVLGLAVFIVAIRDPEKKGKMKTFVATGGLVGVALTAIGLGSSKVKETQTPDVDFYDEGDYFHYILEDENSFNGTSNRNEKEIRIGLNLFELNF